MPQGSHRLQQGGTLLPSPIRPAMASMVLGARPACSRAEPLWASSCTSLSRAGSPWRTEGRRHPALQPQLQPPIPRAGGISMCAAVWGVTSSDSPGSHVCPLPQPWVPGMSPPPAQPTLGPTCVIFSSPGSHTCPSSSLGSHVCPLHQAWVPCVSPPLALGPTCVPSRRSASPGPSCAECHVNSCRHSPSPW